MISGRPRPRTPPCPVLRPRCFCLSLFLCFYTLVVRPTAPAQPTPADTDAVRVNVTLNADGTRTVYQFDQPHRRATATTTTRDGKVVGKIRYEIDDFGRFATGLIFGPNDKFLFKSIYKYDTAGRLEQEIHLNKEDAVINKMIYDYDATGKQTGYSIVDASGKVIGHTSPAKPSPSAKPRKSGR